MFRKTLRSQGPAIMTFGAMSIIMGAIWWAVLAFSQTVPHPTPAGSTGVLPVPILSAAERRRWYISDPEVPALCFRQVGGSPPVVLTFPDDRLVLYEPPPTSGLGAPGVPVPASLILDGSTMTPGTRIDAWQALSAAEGDEAGSRVQAATTWRSDDGTTWQTCSGVYVEERPLNPRRCDVEHPCPDCPPPPPPTEEGCREVWPCPACPDCPPVPDLPAMRDAVSLDAWTFAHVLAELQVTDPGLTSAALRTRASARGVEIFKIDRADFFWAADLPRLRNPT